MTITLQSSQVQQALKERNSTLLHFFQKALAEQYSIVKLSLESTEKFESEASKAAALKEQKAPPASSSTPQPPATEEPQTAPLSQGQDQAAAQEVEELRQAQTSQNAQEPLKPHASQAPQASLQQSQHRAETQKAEAQTAHRAPEQQTLAPKAPDSKIAANKTKLQNSAPNKTQTVQARIIKREDYCTLPPEIQLLQRTFGAEVKEIPQNPEDSI